MSLAALCFYMESKHAQENYEMDCLWAQGTGFQFAENNAPKEPQKYTTRATLPRWSEYLKAQKVQVKEQEGQDVFDIIDAVANGQ